MIKVTSTVESDLVDSLGDCTLSDCLADDSCCVLTILALALCCKTFVIRCCRYKSDSLLVVDDLSLDLLVAPEDDQTGPLGCTVDVLADAVVNPSSSFYFSQCHNSVLLII